LTSWSPLGGDHQDLSDVGYLALVVMDDYRDGEPHEIQ